MSDLSDRLRLARDFAKGRKTHKTDAMYAVSFPAPTFNSWMDDLSALLEEAAAALGNVATWRRDPERERRLATAEAERNVGEYVCQCSCSCMRKLEVPGGTCSNCAQGDHKL